MNYFDKDGFPVTLEGDGGDSAATMGNILVTNELPHAVTLSAYVPGDCPVRHLNTDKWYGRPGRFSRDQLIALLCGLTLRYPDGFVAKKLFKLHRKRFFLTAWNTIRNFQYETLEEHLAKSTPDVKWDMKPKFPDITGPEVWALWIRLKRARLLSPLLLVFDIETFVGAVHWRFFRENNLCRNHLLISKVVRSVMPTPWSYFTHWVNDYAELKRRWKHHCDVCGELYAMKDIEK